MALCDQIRNDILLGAFKVDLQTAVNQLNPLTFEKIYKCSEIEYENSIILLIFFSNFWTEKHIWVTISTTNSV